MENLYGEFIKGVMVVVIILCSLNVFSIYFCGYVVYIFCVVDDGFYKEDFSFLGCLVCLLKVKLSSLLYYVNNVIWKGRDEVSRSFIILIFDRVVLYLLDIVNME